MKKFLQTLMLLAALMVPWAMGAQDSVTVVTIGDGGTTTNSYLPAYSFYNNTLSEQIYTPTELGGLPGTITSVAFYNGGSTKTPENIKIYLVNTSVSEFSSTTAWLPVTAGDLVYDGSLAFTAGQWTTITLTTPFFYDGVSNLGVIVDWHMQYSSGLACRVFTSTANCAMYVYSDGTDYSAIGATYSASSRLSVKNQLQIGIIPGELSCYPAMDVHIIDSLTTSTNLTIGWQDTNNSGVSYNVYIINGTDTTLIDNVSTNTVSIDTLQPNTLYTFAIESDCGSGDLSNRRIVTGRTACAAVSLPYTCGFEENEIMSTSQADALPWCSVRFPSSTAYPNYPYSYSTSYSYSGSRALYFYGATSTSYPDTMAIILPGINIDDYPMGGNRIAFWARMGGDNDSKALRVGTMSNAANRGNINWLDTVTITGSTYRQHSVSLADADDNDSYVVLMALQGSGNIYVDDVTIEEMPSCLEVSDLNVVDSLTTANTVTLTWRDNENTSASYSVYILTPSATAGVYDTTLVDSGVSDTTYTATGLTGNTVYIFAVQSNCGSSDANMITVRTRTSCIVEPLPFSEDFSEALVSCWNGASAQASQVFAGTPLTMDTPSTGWNHTTNRDGFTGGHYYRNVWGSSVYHWLITPSIDLATAESAVLHFDMALTAYSNAQAPSAYTGGQRFMVVVSRDNGLTWSDTNATVWNQTGANADYAFANVPWSEFATYVVNLNQYIGDTVRIAFYCESLNSGGDNDLHIDNIFISEAGAPLVSLPTTMAASLGNPFEIAATLIDGEQPVTYTWSSTMETAGNAVSSSTDSVLTITYSAVGTDTVKVFATNTMGSDSAVTIVNVACQPVSNISLLYGEDNETTISWTGTAAEYEYALMLQTATLDTTNLLTTTDNSITVDTLTSGVAYKFYVRAVCGSYHSTWVLKTFTPGEYILAANSTDTLRTCSAMVYDNGGPNGNYAASQNSTLVILPTSSDKWLVISGTSQTEGSWDYTTIYNGVGDDREQVFQDGTSGDNSQQSFGPFTCPFGATIVFHSDGSTEYAGFAVTVTCIDAPACLPVAGFNVIDSLTTAHTANFIWSADASSYQVEYKKSSDTTWIIETANDTTVQLTGLDANTTYNVRVKSLCGGDESDYSRVITFTTTVACPAPTNLAAGLTPGDGTIALLTWSDPTGSAWQICLNGDTNNYINVTDSTRYLLENLTPEQVYTAKVRRDCTDEQEGYSTWCSMISFTPTNDYSLTVNDGTTTNGYVPIYGTWTDDHIHSQFIIPATSLAQMQYGSINKLIFYSSNSSVSWGSASFQVLMTETDATTVTALADVTEMDQVYSGSLSISGNKMEVVFTAPYLYMGRNLLIAFEEPTSGSFSSCSWYGVSTGTSIGGYGSYVYQQNFLPKTTIYYVPGDEPTCFPVLNLAIVDTLTTENSLTVTWEDTTNNGSYAVYIINGTDTAMFTTTDTTYTFQNLDASTMYTINVATLCGNDEAIVRSVVGRTSCADISVFPHTETFDGADLGCWTSEGQGQWITGVGNAASGTVAYQGGRNARISHSTTGNVTKLISPVLDLGPDAVGVQVTFAHIQSSWSSDIDVHRVLYRTSASGAWTTVAEYTQAIESWVVDNVMLPYNTYQVAFEYTDNYGYGVGIDSVVFTYIDSNYCFPVTDLAVDTATSSSVTLIWSGNAAGYSIYNGNDQIGTTTDTTYTINGLSASTGYTFGVVADCSTTSSSDRVDISVLTDCAGGSCSVTIVGTDDYGDGWNGAYIEILQSGVSIAQYDVPDLGTYETTTDSSSFSVCNGAPVTFVWHSGMYDDEASFIIKDGNDSVIYTVADASSLNDGATIVTVANACSGMTIDTFYVTLISADTSMGTVSPVGPTAVIGGDNFTATATPVANYSFAGWLNATGDTVSTVNPYMFAVTSDITLIGTFRYDAPCAAPTDITFTNTTFTSATVNFTAGEGQTAWVLHLMGSGNDILDTLTTTTHTYTGLFSGTTYQLAIRSLCGSDDSPWSDTVNFSTLTCTQVTGITVSNITGTTARISWPSTGAGVYEVDYGYQGFSVGQGTTVTVSNNSVVLTGLDEETDYDVYVRGVCADGITGLWSTTTSFTTTQAGQEPVYYTITVLATPSEGGTTYGGDSYTENSTASIGVTLNDGWVFVSWQDGNTENPRTITVTGDMTYTATLREGVGIEEVTLSEVSLFPNPATSTVTVTAYGMEQVSLIDLNGRTMMTQRVNDNTTTFDVSNLAKGTYFVRIVGEQATAVRKLIVK